MIITKEQQESWIMNYINDGHSQDECIGFIDGVEKAMSVLNGYDHSNDGANTLLAELEKPTEQ